MNLTKQQWWERFQKYYTEFPDLDLAIDLSRMNVDDAFFASMEPKVKKALADMDALEKGAIANPDENRMVGHYWLRDPELAPTQDIRREIEDTLAKIIEFTRKIHDGTIHGAGGNFKNFLLIGIGGSALGPQFVAHALGDPRTDKMKPFFFDNTDPDGMDRVLASIGDDLNKTLTIVISKSGGTKETRNGMLIAKDAYEKAGLTFERHAVAITMSGSELDKFSSQWITRFPMWDWVGGRTSELSAVGLLPAALQGIKISEMLRGAKECDKTNRKLGHNGPSIKLALAWFVSGNGKGLKNMVLLPYKDRLELFSKYLQQLVMESLGKEKNLSGQTVNQGISVLGNKGSTDQHSYVQQLRDGLNDFFVTFIQVLNDQEGQPLNVEEKVTSGDFLQGFYLGTRQALADNNRESLTLSLKNVAPYAVGLLIALFERAVSYYASFVNINPYHQPGVESGKKASANVISIQNEVITYLNKNKSPTTCGNISVGIDKENEKELVFHICEHLTISQSGKYKKFNNSSISERQYLAV